MHTQRQVRLGVLFASITALLWGQLPIALKVALAFSSAATVVWFRFAFAFAGLFLLLSWRNSTQLRRTLRAPPPLALLAGIFLGANYLGYMQGVHFTSPSVTQLLIQTGPMALVAAGVIFFKERLSSMQGVGIVVAIAGLALFYRDQLGGALKAASINIGILWIAFSAAAWATFAALQKHLGRTLPPQQINLIVYGTAATAFFPAVRWAELRGLTPGQWGLLVFLGLNTLVAYGTLGEALKLAPTGKVSIVLMLNPIITLAFMHVLHACDVSWAPAEHVTQLGWLGALIVVTGAMMVVSRKQEKVQSHAELPAKTA